MSGGNTGDKPVIELKVEGMSCGHCVKAVTASIQSQDPKAKVGAEPLRQRRGRALVRLQAGGGEPRPRRGDGAAELLGALARLGLLRQLQLLAPRRLLRRGLARAGLLVLLHLLPLADAGIGGDARADQGRERGELGHVSRSSSSRW